MSQWARRSCLVLAAFLVLVNVQFGRGQGIGQAASDVVPVGIFSEMDPSRVLPEEGRPISLAAAYDETEYDLVDAERGPVVRVRSTNASFGLAYHRRIDLTRTPILEWSWKIEDVLSSERVGKLGRNDAAGCRIRHRSGRHASASYSRPDSLAARFSSPRLLCP